MLGNFQCPERPTCSKNKEEGSTVLAVGADGVVLIFAALSYRIFFSFSLPLGDGSI